MVNAIRNGIKGVFSDTDWKTGQPQRYGWQEVGKEKKELPKEIIQFIQRRQPEKTVQDELDELSKPEEIKPEIIPAPKKEKQPKKITGEKVTKTKSNDNPKKKERGAAKRNPGRVAKN